MRTIELLSPAKDAYCGMEAVRHGADAVYIGAARFSARAAAGNSWEELERLVRFAHLYRAKVHVALNTILTDAELEEARKMAVRCYEMGVDALIVQDMGLLRADLPPIALHASTQTDVCSVEKVRFLAAAGFQRVVLARELPLAEIAAIHQACPVELEAFVHGSLCVCYSGQCYMSQASCGRSANRGECAQYCRLPYDLTDAEGNLLQRGRHLLSLKDMDRSGYLEEMLEAGVTSLKIEGRLKDADYVKNITLYYRRKLDELMEKSAGRYGKASLGKVYATFEPSPEKSFHRGATDYFLRGVRGEMASMESPKSFGEKVGRVTSVQSRSLTCDSRVALHNGDGLCFVDAQGKLQGFRLNAVREGKLFPLAMPAGLKAGMTLYRNEDRLFRKQLQGETAQRKMRLQICFAGTENGFSLQLTDEEGLQVTVERTAEHQLAEKPDMLLRQLRQQLGKLGQTEFEASEPQIRLPQPWFVPASLMAEMRREAVERLQTLRAAWRPADVCRKEQDATYPFDNQERHLDYRGNVLNNSAKQFYLEHGATVVDWAMEHPDFAAMEGQPLMRCRYCLREALGACLQRHPEAARRYPEPLFLQHGAFRYRLHFDCKACEMVVERAASPRKSGNDW